MLLLVVSRDVSCDIRFDYDWDDTRLRIGMDSDIMYDALWYRHLDEQKVRWYWCMLTFKVIVYCLVFDALIAIQCSCDVKFNCNDDPRLCVDFEFGGIYGTVMC